MFIGLILCSSDVLECFIHFLRLLAFSPLVWEYVIKQNPFT